MIKRDWKRAAAHFPHGVFIALLSATIIFAPLARRFTEMFIVYEESEDDDIGDGAWNDYFGTLIGIAVTGAILFFVFVYVFIKYILPLLV